MFFLWVKLTFDPRTIEINLNMNLAIEILYQNEYVAQVERLNYGTVTACLKPRLHALIYTRCANYTYSMYNLHPGVFLGMWTQLHICKS